MVETTVTRTVTVAPPHPSVSTEVGQGGLRVRPEWMSYYGGTRPVYSIRSIHWDVWGGPVAFGFGVWAHNLSQNRSPKGPYTYSPVNVILSQLTSCIGGGLAYEHWIIAGEKIYRPDQPIVDTAPGCVPAG